MSATKYFKQLKDHIDQAHLVPSFKKEIQASLVYFMVQSELSVDERAHPKMLRQEWMTLSQKTQGLKLFEKLEKDEMLWRTVKCFVHAEEPCSLIVPQTEAKVYKSRYEGWTYIHFFEHLAKSADGKENLTAYEHLFLKAALWYLEDQAHRGRGQRNLRRIKETWSAVQPLLNRMGMLNEFRAESGLRKQVDYFLTDKLGW